MSNLDGARILYDPPADWAEEDCACATAGAPAAQQLHALAGLWQLAPQLVEIPLAPDYSLAFNPFAGGGIAVLNEAAHSVLDSFAQPRPLRSDTESLLATLSLLRPEQALMTPPSPPDTLTAWLHITNACNLRCTYCYLQKTSEAMNESMGRAAVDAVFRSAAQHGFRRVKLKYAGGEATLNFSLVRTLHDHAVCCAQDSSLELQEVVLSNGVALTAGMLDFLKDAQMRLAISLDGLGSEHDTQRAFQNGKGSSHLVARGIDRALSRGVRPYVSITVTAHNAGHLADVVSFALDRSLLFNLNFYREPQPGASWQALKAEEDRLIAGVQQALGVIEDRLPPYSLIGALLDRSSFVSPHSHACGAGDSYLVIDQRGGIARCQMEIERTITSVSAADPLSEIRLYDQGFQNVAVDEKEGCRDCTWKYWCGGGCSLLTYRLTGRSDIRSPYCRVYKAVFPELVRLEGLRLLKWQAGDRMN